MVLHSKTLESSAHIENRERLTVPGPVQHKNSGSLNRANKMNPPARNPVPAHPTPTHPRQTRMGSPITLPSQQAKDRNTTLGKLTNRQPPAGQRTHTSHQSGAAVEHITERNTLPPRHVNISPPSPRSLSNTVQVLAREIISRRAPSDGGLPPPDTAQRLSHSNLVSPINPA